MSFKDSMKRVFGISNKAQRNNTPALMDIINGTADINR